MSSIRKTRVAVLMGGRSSEHEVSLNSGCMICNALDRSRYQVKPVTITRQGEWLLPRDYHPGDPPLLAETLKSQKVATTDELVVARQPQLLVEGDDRIDVVFIALHGPYGEDGCIQGLFEILDVPYTGCDVKANAVAMDKVLSKLVYEAIGLKTPKYVALSERDRGSADFGLLTASRVGFPCVVKPATQGSSVGITLCQSRDAFEEALTDSFRYHPVALVEEYIDGVEVTCGVLEDPGTGRLEPLPLIEIVPKESAFFDYHAKYTPGATDEICPARVDPSTSERVQQMTLAACKTIGVRGFSRADFIIREGETYLLEINTIPGMTPTSLLPQAAGVAGIEFPAMLDRILLAAQKAHREKQRRGC